VGIGRRVAELWGSQKLPTGPADPTRGTQVPRLPDPHDHFRV